MYDKLKVVSPTYYSTLNNLGIAYTQLKEYKKAYESYKRSVEGYLSIKNTTKAQTIFKKLASNLKEIGRQGDIEELEKRYGLKQ